jgi:LysM repeat protein
MGSVRRSGNNAFFLFLGLNVLVSLVTVLAVLSIWDRRSPAPRPLPTSTIDAAALLASAIPTATETLVPTPTPSVYRVQPNDTLFAIALQLGVSLADLMELNDLTESSVLDVGQVLLVPTPGGPEAPTDTPAPQAQSSPTRPAAAEAPHVVIVGVAGVGDLAQEAVQLINSGGVAAMAGWTLDDGQGAVYLFPEFTLHKGAVSIHTRAGSDTVIDLFWALDRPLWSSGKTISLRDANGAIQSTFSIPQG